MHGRLSSLNKLRMACCEFLSALYQEPCPRAISRIMTLQQWQLPSLNGGVRVIQIGVCHNFLKISFLEDCTMEMAFSGSWKHLATLSVSSWYSSSDHTIPSAETNCFEHACEHHPTFDGELSSGAVVTTLNEDSSHVRLYFFYNQLYSRLQLPVVLALFFFLFIACCHILYNADAPLGCATWTYNVYEC